MLRKYHRKCNVSSSLNLSFPPIFLLSYHYYCPKELALFMTCIMGFAASAFSPGVAVALSESRIRQGHSRPVCAERRTVALFYSPFMSYDLIADAFVL